MKKAECADKLLIPVLGSWKQADPWDYLVGSRPVRDPASKDESELHLRNNT